MKLIPIVVTLLLGFGVSSSLQTLLGVTTPQQQHGQVKILLLPLVSIRPIGDEGRDNKGYEKDANDVGYKQVGLNKENYRGNQAVTYDDEPDHGKGSEYGPNNRDKGDYIEPNNEGKYQGGSFQASSGDYNVAAGRPGNYEQLSQAENSGKYGGTEGNSYSQIHPENYGDPSGQSQEYGGGERKQSDQTTSIGYDNADREKQYGGSYSKNSAGNYGNRVRQGNDGNPRQFMSGNYGAPGREQDFRSSSSQTTAGNYNWRGYTKPSGYDNTPQGNQEGSGSNNGRENGYEYALASQDAQGTGRHSTPVGVTTGSGVYSGTRGYEREKIGTTYNRPIPIKASLSVTSKGSQVGFETASGRGNKNGNPIIIVTDFNSRKQPLQNYDRQSNAYTRAPGSHSSPTRATYYPPNGSYNRPTNGATGAFKEISHAKISSSYRTNADKPNSRSNVKGSIKFGDSRGAAQANTRGYSRITASSINYGGPTKEQGYTSNNNGNQHYNLQNSGAGLGGNSEYGVSNVRSYSGSSNSNADSRKLITYSGNNGAGKASGVVYGETEENSKYVKSTDTSRYGESLSRPTNYRGDAEDNSSTVTSSSSEGSYNEDNKTPRTAGLIPIIVIQSFGGSKLNNKDNY